MRIRDALLWLALGTVLLGERAVQGPVGTPWWVVLLGVLGLGVAVAISRVRPGVAAVLVGTLNLLAALVHLIAQIPAFPLAYSLALLVMSYLAGRRAASTRIPLLAVVAVVALGLVAAAVTGIVADGLAGLSATLLTWVYALGILLVAAVVPWFAGRFRHQQVALAHAGWERAEHLEREQRVLAERERLRERARIAYDMHDSLGHALSLVALRAGAIELAPGLDDDQRRAAGELRAATAGAVERLHDVIGVLRDGNLDRDGGDHEPAPLRPVERTVADLVAGAAESGMVVTLTGDGDQPSPDRVRHAVQRVAQEALTNAAKHAPGVPVTVQVQRSVRETAVTVRNATPLAAPEPPPPGGRLGLIGLRERVRLAGGTLRAGPGDGSFTVHAVLPHHHPGSTAQPDVSESTLHRRDAQRHFRRTLGWALGIPAACAAALVTIGAAYALSVAQYSTLNRAQFDVLVPGTPVHQVEPVLPPLQVARPSYAPPDPAGTGCRFYRRDANVFTGPAAVFRLCFADRLLVAKDELVWPGDADR